MIEDTKIELETLHTPSVLRGQNTPRNISRNIPRRQNRLGFTLLELLITIVIAVLLIALAVPSLTRFVRQGQYTSAGNELITGFNYARNEAINRQRAVAVAANSGGWVNGWQAFLDVNRNAVFDNGTDVLLRNGNPITGIDIVSSFTSAAFDQNGRRTNETAAFLAFEVSKSGGPADLVRRICVARNGRIFTVFGAVACV